MKENDKDPKSKLFIPNVQQKLCITCVGLWLLTMMYNHVMHCHANGRLGPIFGISITTQNKKTGKLKIDGWLRTDICLLCLSIQCISCTLIRATASYHTVSAGSTPEGGHWPFPPSARGARMFESILHNAWWSSLFRLWGARLRGLAFATKEADAFRPPSVFTWQSKHY